MKPVPAATGAFGAASPDKEKLMGLHADKATRVFGTQTAVRRALMAILMLGTLAGVPACERITNLTTRAARPDVPLPYRTRFTRGEDRRDIAITVESRGAGLNDVREAVRYEATRYCLQSYGSSDADWQIDAATGDWFFTTDGTVLAFQARCTGRS